MRELIFNKIYKYKLAISNYYRWWLLGITYLVPQTFLRFFNFFPDIITIEFSEKIVLIKRYDVDKDECIKEISIDIDSDLENKKDALRRLLINENGLENICLLIPDSHILNKTILLPEATKNNLRQILGFEMDRQTPFTNEQVYYDYNVSKKETNNNDVFVELYACLREYINPLVEEIQAWGWQVNVITENDSNIYSPAYNLLPQEKQSNNKSRSKSLTLVLVILASILFASVLYTPLYIREEIVADLEVRIDASRKVALQIEILKREKDILYDKMHFLENKQNIYINSIELLNEVTLLLPDNTWLRRLGMEGNDMQLYGESTSATELIELIDSSNYFTNSQFISPIMQNNKTKKDKFSLSTHIVEINPS